MQKKILIILAVFVVIALGAWLLYKKPVPNLPPPALPNIAGAPIGLIGTITAVGTGSITVEGQPPGNAAPVVLQLSIGSSTSLIKVSATYATSSITFADLSVGERVNISADAADANGIRPAERVTVIPPAQQ